MNTTVGVFSTHLEAENAINELRSLGVKESDLSYLYIDAEGKMKDETSNVGEGAAKGAAAGTAIGALAGLVVATGILPGLGTLFVAGPLATALGLTGVAATTAAGAVTGLAAGGILGGLVSMGVSREDAEMYQDMVEKGNVVVIAKSDDLLAKDVFVRESAIEVREYTEV